MAKKSPEKKRQSKKVRDNLMKQDSLAKKSPTKKRQRQPKPWTKAKLTKENAKLRLRLYELGVMYKQTAGSLEDRDGIIKSHQRHIEMFTQERERLMEYKRHCTAWGQLVGAVVALLPEPQGAALRLLASLLGLNKKPESEGLSRYSEAQLANAAREAARRSPDWAVVTDGDMANPRRASEIDAAESSEAADREMDQQFPSREVQNEND